MEETEPDGHTPMGLSSTRSPQEPLVEHKSEIEKRNVVVLMTDLGLKTSVKIKKPIGLSLDTLVSNLLCPFSYDSMPFLMFE